MLLVAIAAGIIIFLIFIILIYFIYTRFRGIRYVSPGNINSKFSKYVYKNSLSIESYNIVLVVGDAALKMQLADSFIVTDLQYTQDSIEDESSEIAKITFIYIKNICLIIPKEIENGSEEKSITEIIKIMSQYSQNKVAVNSILLLCDIDEDPVIYQKQIVAVCEHCESSIPVYSVINIIYNSEQIQSFVKAASGSYLLQTCGYAVEEYTRDVNTHVIQNRFIKMGSDIEALCLSLNLNTSYNDSKNIIQMCHKVKNSIYELTTISTKICNMFNNVHRPYIRGFYITFCAVYFNLNRFIFLSDLIGSKIYEERNLVFYDKTSLNKRRSKLLEVVLSIIFVSIMLKVGYDSYTYFSDYYYLQHEISVLTGKIENFNVENNNTEYLQDLVSSFSAYKKRRNHRFNLYLMLSRTLGIRNKVSELVAKISDQLIFLLTGMIKNRIDSTISKIYDSISKAKTYGEIINIVDSNYTVIDRNFNIINRLQDSSSNKEELLNIMGKIKSEYKLDSKFYEFIKENIDVISDMLASSSLNYKEKTIDDFCVNVVEKTIQITQDSTEFVSLVSLYDLCDSFFNEKEISRRIDLAYDIHQFAKSYNSKQSYEVISLSFIQEIIAKLSTMFNLNKDVVKKLQNMYVQKAHIAEDRINDRVQIVLGHLFEIRDSNIFLSQSFESLISYIKVIFKSDMYKFYKNYVKTRYSAQISESKYISFGSLQSLSSLTKNYISMLNENKNVTFISSYMNETLRGLYNSCLDYVIEKEIVLIDNKVDSNVIEKAIVDSFNNNIGYIAEYLNMNNENKYVDSTIDRFFTQIIKNAHNVLNSMTMFRDSPVKIQSSIPVIQQITNSDNEQEAYASIVLNIKKSMQKVLPYYPILEYINSNLYRRLEQNDKQKLEMILETVKVYNDYIINSREAELHRLIDSVTKISTENTSKTYLINTVYQSNFLYKEYARSVNRIKELINEHSKREVNEEVSSLKSLLKQSIKLYPIDTDASSTVSIVNLSNMLKRCQNIISKVNKFNEINKTNTSYKGLLDIVQNISNHIRSLTERINIDLSVELDKVFENSMQRTISITDMNTNIVSSYEIEKAQQYIPNINIAQDSTIIIKLGPIRDNNLYYDEFKDSSIECGANSCIIYISNPAILNMLVSNRSKVSIKKNKYSVYYRVPIIIKNLLKSSVSNTKTSGLVKVTATLPTGLLNDLYNMENIQELLNKLENYI